ncbi:MAG: ATP-binding protein [Planctomycetes bacterium]|nr:ATP-binding protein [Planctomycetota bacterium]
MDSGVLSIPLDEHGSADRSASLSRTWPLREFITDAENAIIRIAAESVFSPETPFNPLVFVGPTATGKSRLARSLVQRWKLLNPGREVIITNGADFARAYANAIHTDAITELRQRFLAADLVFLDDLQQLSNKPASQRMFATIVEALVEQNKRIIVTAQSLPTSQAAIEPRLAGRLSVGLSVPFNTPGQKARREITLRLAKAHNITIDRHTLFELSDNLAVSVPALNRAVVELQSSAQLDETTSDSERVKQLLLKYRLERQPTLKAITQSTCRYFNVKSADARGSSRRKGVVLARSIAMYLGRKLTDLSLEQIGKYFGGRDHTTVLHSYRKIDLLADGDPQISAAIRELSNEVKGIT